MASPQPNEFTRISNELYRAIMQTNFSKRQRNILDLVIRMSYGCGKKTAILRPVDFELVGVYKSHVRKDLDYLREAKVLFIQDDCITLNKDYDEWRVSISRGSEDRKKFEAILHRNLTEKVTESVASNNNEVTETVTEVTELVTPDNQEVTETVTKVTEIVTDPKGDGYQNSNHEVTETVTECAPEPAGDKASSLPKESIKESTGIDISPPTPPNKKSKPKTLDEILKTFPRYSEEHLRAIGDYWETIRFTRRTGSVALSIVARQMEYWERFPVDIVLKALKIHQQKYQSKREDYTAGIMRRLLQEQQRQRGASPDERIQPRAHGDPEIDFEKFLWSGSQSES